MVDVGQFLFDTFGADGGWGVVFCIFLIFLIDAFLFPTLPELFFILGFSYDPSVGFGLELLLAAVVAEWIGIFSLYYVVKHIRIPQKVTRVVDKYIKKQVKPELAEKVGLKALEIMKTVEG